MPWLWRAHYTDGTMLDEHEGDKIHGWKDVDLDRLAAFELVPQDVDGEYSILPQPLLKVTPTMRPIFFRRNVVIVDPHTYEEKDRIILPCLGWQKTVEGVNVKSFTFYYEDGSIVVTDDDKDIG
jgi:hypothetical protein